ncbi:SdpI family protein [Phycisphaera mikurensis]|uniref:SdpI family protein n=1 Tax=Phycisphaera mikurensis (strain NBRC 102666 / KCTC 22515 / FYK2301M01) TaxID=1142394 RepID=I0ID99_PHYMF|nr:SdpI family protein [Phycisphaera mikurensis]MBB6442362.1 hypothetical protein [Phycisphaera mikurensis]BAM03237.1 hypothetical protein PSMK_10780 [Phycisphaera mikurensis NBRC 102666]
MNPAFLLCLLNLLLGLMCVGSAVPLIRGKVKPNLLFGLRTRTTLRDDAAWYRLNAACGRWLLPAGVALVASGVVGWLLIPAVPGSWLVGGLLASSFLPVIGYVPLLLDRT